MDDFRKKPADHGSTPQNEPVAPKTHAEKGGTHTRRKQGQGTTRHPKCPTKQKHDLEAKSDVTPNRSNDSEFNNKIAKVKTNSKNTS